MTLAGSRPITLVLASFEDIVSRGLQALVDEDPGLELLGADVELDRLADELTRHAPDVALVNFGSLSSPAELHELSAGFPEVRLVVLANNPTAAESKQLISFGATACLAKSTEARDIRQAIYLASRGMHVLPEASPAPPVAYESPGPAPLTAREADVLELLQTGHSNAEIAAVLHVGVETVRTHVRHIYRKLGVGSRRELRVTG